MKKSQLVYFLLALTLLVGACAPAAQPTVDASAVAQQIENSVALTVAANDALTAAAIPANTATPLPPTSTPFPTLTPFATLTPFVVTPGTGNGGGGGGGGGAGPTQDPRYSCKLIDQEPLDSSPATILKVGDTLDVKWTLKNDGTKPWKAATYSWLPISEKVLSDIPANQSLSMSPVPFTIGIGLADVLPGKTIVLKVELTAPAAFEGNKPIWITVQMAVIGDGVKFCRPYIQVEIIRPGMTP
jgi:hypothetical protein